MSSNQFLNMCQQRVNQHLSSLVADSIADHQLQQAIHYSLMNGGKRLRPALVYASAHCLGNCVSEIKPSIDSAAAAVECIHAYSLIHDDLPAMDNDDLRRGMPTCHKAFNEATAILAGDALQTLGFECLASIDDLDAITVLKMVRHLAAAAGGGGMVAGQSIDLAAVKQQLSLKQLERMHNYKTGALITVSIYLGAFTMNASKRQLQALDDYARAVGLAFQIKDDILDNTTETAILGKRQGADKVLNKPTYVSLMGLKKANQRAQHLYEQSLDAISEFGDSACHLRQLSNYIINREH